MSRKLPLLLVLLAVSLAGTCQGQSSTSTPIVKLPTSQPASTADLTGRWRLNYVGELNRVTNFCIDVRRLTITALLDGCFDSLPGVTLDDIAEVDAGPPAVYQFTFAVAVSSTVTVATTVVATEVDIDNYTIVVNDQRTGDGQLTTTGGPYMGTMVRQ